MKKAFFLLVIVLAMASLANAQEQYLEYAPSKGAALDFAYTGDIIIGLWFICDGDTTIVPVYPDCGERETCHFLYLLPDDCTTICWVQGDASVTYRKREEDR